MKYILILTSILVFADALPVYEGKVDGDDPQNYKNIEILILESAVDQDGGYSFSFENDDGSKVSQEGQHTIVDDEHAVESIKGSYSYNDVNGQPVSLTYTADERGFLPVGAHLPTPPPIPLEILRSLRYLATAKPFVDEQLYDYQPKKKVFRGRQYNTGNVETRSRNNLRSNTFPELLTDNTPSEVLSKSAENQRDSKADTAPETTPETTVETTSESAQETSDSTNMPAVQTASDVLNESKKKINEALRESLKKTSNLTQSATKETANAAIAAVRDEVAKLTDIVKTQKNKIKDKIAETSENIDKEVSAPVKEFVSDAVVAADETPVNKIDLNLKITT